MAEARIRAYTVLKIRSVKILSYAVVSTIAKWNVILSVKRFPVGEGMSHRV